MEESFLYCPYCFQQISMLIDLSINRQEYVEDCEVCCNPITIKVMVQDRQVVQLEAEKPY